MVDKHASNQQASLTRWLFCFRLQKLANHDRPLRRFFYVHTLPEASTTTSSRTTTSPLSPSIRPLTEAVFFRPKSMKKSFRPKQAAEFLGIGVATFWRWAKERHDFPKMIRLSARCTVIDGDQLVAWRDAQAEKVA